MRFLGIIYILLISLLSSCSVKSVIDDYMLGKDNTPIPHSLEAIKPKVSIKEYWVSGVGSSYKHSAYLKLQPVIIGDKIYVASASGIVQALSKKNGKVYWKQALKSGIMSGPSVGDGILAVTTDRATVVGIQLKNGQPLWETNVSSDVLSKPFFDDHLVMVKTVDGAVYALNEKTGAVVWSFTHGSPHLILKASSSPVAYENYVLAGFSDGKLIALNRVTGHEIWQKSIAYPNGSSDVDSLVDIDADPILRGDVVYLATYQGYTGAFSLEQGDFIWSKPASVYKNISVGKHALYLTDTKDIIWSYQRSSGQVLWQQVNLKARAVTEPIVMDRGIVVADKLGWLHILSENTGAFIGRINLNSPIDIAPAVQGNTIAVTTRDGRLHYLVVN